MFPINSGKPFHCAKAVLAGIRENTGNGNKRLENLSFVFGGGVGYPAVSIIMIVLLSPIGGRGYRKSHRTRRNRHGSGKWLLRHLSRNRRVWKSWLNLKPFAGFQIRIYRISFQFFHHCF